MIAVRRQAVLVLSSNSQHNPASLGTRVRHVSRAESAWPILSTPSEIVLEQLCCPIRINQTEEGHTCLSVHCTRSRGCGAGTNRLRVLIACRSVALICRRGLVLRSATGAQRSDLVVRAPSTPRQLPYELHRQRRVEPHFRMKLTRSAIVSTSLDFYLDETLTEHTL